MRVATKNKLRIRRLMIAVVALIGLIQLSFTSFALHPSLIYRRDFIQEYLLARAVLAGVNPYRPIPEVAQQLLKHHSPGMLRNAIAHPPPMSVISLPLGLLSYEQASVVWFLLEILLVIIAVYLLLRWWGKPPRPGIVVSLALMAFVWDPLTDEMIVGQLGTLLLLFLLLAWQDLRAGKSVAAGFWLGGVLSVKLIAWPIVFFLILRRNWSATVTSMTVVISLHLVACLLIGGNNVVSYYQKTAPAVTRMYRAHEGNISSWSLGWRVFEGMHFEGQRSVAALPLVEAPVIARLTSFFMPLLLLVVGLWLAAGARHPDSAFGILVCVSVLVNPISWNHYLLITVIPATIAFYTLATGWWPRWIRLAALVVGGLLFLPMSYLREAMLLFRVGEEVRAEGRLVTIVPFAAGLITLIPLLAVLGLMWLVWYLDRNNQNRKEVSTDSTSALTSASVGV